MAKNTISLSAWVIVKCQLMLWRSPRWRSLVDEKNIRFYEACGQYCKNRSVLFRLLGLLPDGFKLWLLERALAIGAAQHFILRKKAIAAQLKTAASGGVGQLVVIGSGFDLLALNTASDNPGIRCFEIDMPEMQRIKADIARSVYGALPANFNSIGADLSQSTLYDILSSNPQFEEGRKTFYVAEGITMYLKESHIKGLFSDMGRLSKGGAYIAFTAIEAHETQHKSLVERLRDLFLSSSGEHFVWSLPKASMPGFLAGQGFSQQQQINYDDLQKPYRTEEEMKQLQWQHGEYLIYAQIPIG